MRIAYLTEWSPYAETGVLKKLVNQVSTWRTLGVEAEVFAICPLQDVKPACNYLQFGRVIGTFNQSALEKYPFARLGYLNKIFSVPEVKRRLRTFRPDVIYYRQQGPWYPGLGSLLRVAPTVVEINIVQEESKLWGFFLGVLDSNTKAFVQSRDKGFVCMTDEIAEPFRKTGLSVAVIPNALPLTPPAFFPPSGNKVPNLVMVATPLRTSACWHGVDKLFDLAKALPEFQIHVVGYTASQYPEQQIPSNLHFHGVVVGDALAAIYARCDIGIASVAAYRHNAKEGCALKTREYLAYGLPVILGYVEAEKPLREADFMLQIGNYENNVKDSIGAIRQFVLMWMGRRVVHDFSFMSAATKERQRLDFMGSVARQR